MTPWGSLFEGKSSSSPGHSRQGEVDKDVVGPIGLFRGKQKKR